LLLLCDIVPALNTLLGLALVELKFAPDPTASADAASTANSAAMIFRGEVAHRALVRDIRCS
jgi:hypothetical protein